MKRSEINAIMRKAAAFLREHHFHLPPFARWTPDDWQQRGPECSEIVTQQLGWDITDFGSGDFAKIGLFLFTVRNGVLDQSLGKTYAEKLMIAEPGQITPTHFHHQKMEDIINRGGGNLVIRLWNALPDDELADTPVNVSVNGIQRTVPAGGAVTLAPGESICLPQRLYHTFRGDHSTTLIGEVSRVNDDHTDNRFHAHIGRFPKIEEDEEPLHLLTQDYARYFRA